MTAAILVREYGGHYSRAGSEADGVGGNELGQRSGGALCNAASGSGGRAGNGWATGVC